MGSRIKHKLRTGLCVWSYADSYSMHRLKFSKKKKDAKMNEIIL